jgi:hypothetical protein
VPPLELGQAGGPAGLSGPRNESPAVSGHPRPRPRRSVLGTGKGSPPASGSKALRGLRVVGIIRQDIRPAGITPDDVLGGGCKGKAGCRRTGSSPGCPGNLARGPRHKALAGLETNRRCLLGLWGPANRSWVTQEGSERFHRRLPDGLNVASSQSQGRTVPTLPFSKPPVIL